VSSDLRGDLVAALAGFYTGHPDVERYPMLSEVGGLLAAALDTADVVINRTGGLAGGSAPRQRRSGE